MGYSSEFNGEGIGGVYPYAGGIGAGGLSALDRAFVMAHIKGDKELIEKFDDLITALREREAKEKQEEIDYLKKQLDAVPLILSEQNKRLCGFDYVNAIPDHPFSKD